MRIYGWGSEQLRKKETGALMGGEIISREDAGGPARNRRWPKAALKFCAALLASCALAAGFMFILAVFAFRLRLSAEVIRAGILALYILPCMAGGRVLRGLKFTPSLLWGAGLGAAFYILLLAVSWFFAGMQYDGAVEPGIPLLCIAGGAAGGLRKKKGLQFTV